MNYEDYVEISSDAAEQQEVYMINSELSLARRIVENTSANLFLTGKAGTGKTTFLKRLREETFKNMVVLAPTGVAAINAGGMTIHSFFQFSFSPFIPRKGFAKKETNFKLTKEKRKIIRSLDLIVIDEISMVRPDLLDAIDDSLRRIRNNDRPFGGVQLLLIGDLRQLSPVKIEQEWNLIKDYYRSEFFFESLALREAGFLTIELKEIYRQTDPDFIRILNAVRDGFCGPDIINTLNLRYRPDFNPPDSEKYIRLTSHNYRANSINDAKMKSLDTPEIIFEAVVSGTFPESAYPAEEFLCLKEGAQVMFIKNDTEYPKRFFNGMIGTIVEIDNDKVIVDPADGSPLIEVAPAKWENNVYSVDEETNELKETTVGTFSQIPLRPAWAITIHKSQGLTFSKAIIDASAAFAPGQTYVALSRCKNLEGLVLDSRISPSSIMTDGNVNRFLETERLNKPDEKLMISLSRKHFGELICELFSFGTLRNFLVDYLRAESEFIANIMPDYHIRLTDADKIVREEMYPVGLRFSNLYKNAFRSPLENEGNEAMIKKVRRGCEYFLVRIRPLKELLEERTVVPDNKQSAKRLKNNFDVLNEECRLKEKLLNIFSTTDFSPELYLKAKAEFNLSSPEKRSSSATQKRSATKSTDNVLSDLYSTLTEWRFEKSRQRELPAFTIMSNSILKAICDCLPQSHEELLSIPGLGKKRIELYGDDIIKLVKDSMAVSMPSEAKTPKIPSDIKSFEMWKKGYSIPKIAGERKLSLSTVTAHLLKHIDTGEISEEEIAPKEILDLIWSHIPDKAEMTSQSLNEVYDSLLSKGAEIADSEFEIIKAILFYRRRKLRDIENNNE